MFTSSVRGGKAFAAEQKIREFKTRVSKLNAQKMKVSPAKIVQNSMLNMNLMKSVKYGLSLEEIEMKSLQVNVLKQFLIFIELKKLINSTTDLIGMTS